jgi:tetratricopeptide (TPR) repeat protein
VKRRESKRSGGIPHSRTPSVETLHSNSLRLILGCLLTLAVVGGGIWYWPHRQTTPLPQIDLANLDPPVVTLIQKHLDEVRSQPRSASTWGKLGLLLGNYSIHALARQCLAEAERLDARDPRWPYSQSLLLATEAPEEALAKLRRTVQLCGNDPEAPRLRLATLLAEAGHWDESDRECRELLRAKPDFKPALLLTARHAQSRGKLAEATSLAQRCADDPRTARAAAILLANLYVRQGDTPAASNQTRRISALAPDVPVADPYQAAAAALRSDPRVLTEETHPLLASGHLKEAGLLIDRLMKEHSNYAETWLLAGRYQLLRKDPAAAEQSLQKHLQLEPRSGQGLFQLGMVQLAQERFAEASETFLKAAQLKPDLGPAFYNRGFALVRAGNIREAAPAFREAIRLNPERIDSYLMLADLALRRGDGAEAAKWLQQAEPLNPAHPGLRQLREKALRLEKPNLR